MKWPLLLTFVRHAESFYNILRGMKEADPLYQEFVTAYEADFFSAKTRKLAEQVMEKYALKKSDYETEITENGKRQAHVTGEKLRDLIALPDVVMISPYVRPQQTFSCMMDAWPELAKVKVVIDDRLREQEHGLANLYNDWRVFHVFHPEQKRFYELQGPYWYQYPQGESTSHVRDRSRSNDSTLIREYAGQSVMEITHHLTILSKRANYERLSPEEFLRLDKEEKPINCGVTIYRCDPKLGSNGRLVLECYNKKLY